MYELHSRIEVSGALLGVISLNYDDVLDEAYETIYGSKANYFLTGEADGNIPLLKLHGSFNWRNIKIYDKRKTISIIPLGVNKNYLIPPYNFIWGKAFEVLSKCDVLRLIGCSLNQSDIGLIDLLFKAHLERNDPIEIQVIDFSLQADKIKSNYGFFKNIVKPEDIEGTLIPDVLTDATNPFKIWLKAKAEKMLPEEIAETKFLKKCI